MSSSIDIGISQDQRQQIADGLGRLLADTWVLYGKTHGFHWNVTGPMFNSLHGMFDTQYNELWDSLDEIAERIRALGMPAPFRRQHPDQDGFSRRSTLHSCRHGHGATADERPRGCGTHRPQRL